MFFARRNGLLSNEEHLAEMVSLLGPPPVDFLQRSERSWRYFDEQGALSLLPVFFLLLSARF